MRPAYEPQTDQPHTITESCAPIKGMGMGSSGLFVAHTAAGTIIMQWGEITMTFCLWTIYSGVTYICGMKALT